MSVGRTKLQSCEGLSQTEDEFAPTDDESLQAEDEMVQTMDEDFLTEDSVTEAEAGGKQDKAKEKKSKRKQRQSSIKEAREVQRPDKRQILRMMHNIVPYLAALFLLCALAFSIVAVARSNVDAYGEKVYQENEEYLSYE